MGGVLIHRPLHKSAVIPVKMLYRGIRESGMTLNQVSKRSGVSPATIETWFYRARTPQLQNFMAVAGAVNLNVVLEYGGKIDEQTKL